MHKKEDIWLQQDQTRLDFKSADKVYYYWRKIRLTVQPPLNADFIEKILARGCDFYPVKLGTLFIDTIVL